MKFRNLFLQSLSLFIFSLFFSASALAVQEPQLFMDINPGSSGSYPGNFNIFNNKMYFSGSDAVGSGLWVSNGTSEETFKLKGLSAGNYFFADESNGLLFFVGNNGVNGLEPWVSNGTADGTFMLKDINSGLVHSNPVFFTFFGDKLFFKANDATNGYELWVSDGTTDGTYMLKDIYPGVASASPGYFVTFNNRLYFGATNSVNGGELWTSDGTIDGTYMLKDICLGSTGSSPSSLTVFDNKIFFVAYDSTNHYELWTSDGTVEGTSLFKDINPGFFTSSISYLTVFNDKLFFSATDGGANGRELWTSDGTVNGTHMLKDINPGTNGSTPLYIAVYGDKLYFKADNGINGAELWTSDGTVSGTYMLKDIYPGSTSSSPTNLVAFNNKVYFSASDGTNGTELWATDGTTDGTYLFKDIYSGASSSNPQYPLVFDGKLFFRAKNLLFGDEAWVITLSSDKNPTSFSFESLGAIGNVNTIAHTVSISVPSNTDLSSLIPTITIPADGSISPASGAVQDFTNPVTYTVTAEDGSTQEYVVTVTKLAAAQTIPDASGSATLDSTFSELLVSSSSQELTVTVDDESSNPTLNVSSLVSSASATLPKTTITTSKTTVSIPETTIITSSNAAWTGDIKVPTSTTVTLPTSSGKTSIVSKALIFGSTDSNLTFNKGVRIVLPGDAGKLASYSHDGITFTEITNVCDDDSQTTGDALADDGECKIDVGDDLVVWTKHFTTFVTYTLSDSAGSSSSGNGGNSSSNNPGSTSCTDAKPVVAPTLFQIDAGGNTAKLYFTPISNSSEFVISFATDSSAEQFGETVNLSKDGVQAHHIYELQPNTTYYFKVRGQNGCMPGEWSNVMEIKTLGKGVNSPILFYKDQIVSTNKTISKVATSSASFTTKQEKEMPTNANPKQIEVKETINKQVQEQVQAPIQKENFFDKAINFIKSIF